jgi:regulator of sigma E protease
MLGGIIVNVLLGIVIFAMLLFAYGDRYIVNNSVKNGIYADSLGLQLGLRDGDKIVSVNGKPFEKFDERIILKEIVFNNANALVVNRDGAEQTVAVPQGFGQELATYKNKDKSIMLPRIPAHIGEVVSGKAAEQAGLQKDDVLLGINEKALTYTYEYINYLKNVKNQTVSFKILRGSDTITKPVSVNEEGKIGITFKDADTFFEVKRQKYGFFESFPAGAVKGFSFIGDQVKAFGQMFRGKIKASESLGGLGSMAKMFSPTWDWEHFWRMTGTLSFILAFMNLLPIPGLDGGYVVFLLWEMITGRKPNDKVVEKATSIGLIFLLGLMLYANGMDVVRAWFSK